MTASAPMLEHDYRQLALISRKSAASSGLTSLLWSSSNAESEDIKDAAERVLLLLRSASAIDRIDSETLMRPVQLACQSKRPELVGQALGIVQKLAGLTNSEHVEGLIGPDEINTVLGLLQSVETLYEESVQLKILQTCLVVLQSPRLHPRNAETILSVVSMCFRAMTPRGKGQVTTTASATVRQAVAIVFSYVDVAKAMTLTNGATSAINSTESVDEDVAADSGQAFANKEYIKASSRLLEDLIALSSGSPARWLKTPSLPNQNTFSLEVLDFALLSHPALFLSLPAFENSISLRIVQLLQSQLQDHIDAASKGTASSNFEAFKAVLKCVRTSLLLYHNVAGRKCRSLVHTLLKGLQSCSSLIHRVAIAQVMRQLLADPELVIFLFATFDAADIGASRTVSPTMAMAASRKEDIAIAIIDVMTSLAESGDGSSATMDAVSQVYFSKDVSFDVDIESTMPAGLQGTSLIVVSLHAVVACMQSVSAIVSHQLYGVDRNDGSQRIDGTGPSRPPGPSGRTESIEELPSSASLVSRLSSFSSPRAFHHPHLPLGDVDRELCEALVAATWAPLVLSITHILKQCSHERLELELLKSLRIFTEAIGKLRLREPMTACLDSLCQIALSGVGSPGIGVAETATDEETTSTATVTPSNTQKVTSQLLRSRNFQAMKTIFEIAGELANDLGPAWNMVLEAMYSMDNVLMDPAVVGSADARVLADIADVKRTMQSLFDSTKYMSREGAVSLLGGLRDVSLHHLPQAEMVSSPKMSALYRMVDVFLANSFRAHDLWAPFLSHVLELLQDSKPSIREAAIDALGKAITGTLANLHSGGLEIGVSNNDNHIEDENASVQIDRLENMVLVALESLYNDRERDVQVGVLKVLAQVLQRNGEHLTDGWIPVFRLLAASAETSSLETVALGCESLQIVYNDYLDKMDDRNIQKFLSVAENYGKQAMDVNVSLSIISMLWNLGDMLGSRDGGGGRTGGGGALSSAGGSDISTEDLLETIYEALFKISKDARPEVRNSGARSLFAMVAAHGNRLSPGLWTACLWDKLFPLLRYSFHMSVTSSKEEAEAALLGQSKGEQVRLVVHHSRNTEQKQWDETVVVCLAGMARLMNSQFERMTRMDGFDDGWSELMLVVESSLAGGRKEVALAAISFLSGLLSGDSGAGCAGCAPGANLADHNNSNRLSEPMWQRGFRAIDVGVVAATSGGCQVPLAVRTELVGLVGAVYEANQDRFDRDRAATVQLYKWVDSFCRNPWSEDDAANPVQPVGMPPVQKSALALLQRLRPGQDAVVWPDYLQAVVNLIEPGHAIAALSGGSVMESHESEALPPPSLAQYRFALNASFVERVMDHLVSLFDVAPMSARAAASPEIINALGRCMELRHLAYDVTLWRTAANVFLRLAPLGATAVDAMHAVSDKGGSRIWSCLSEALSRFFFGPDGSKDEAVSRKTGSENQPVAPASPAASAGTVTTAQSSTRKGHSTPVIPFLKGTTGDSRKKKTVGRLFSGKGVAVDDVRAMAEGAAATTSDPAHIVDETKAIEDAELELKVLDCLTDEILTSCGSANQADVDALILVIEEGMSRPAKFQIPVSAKHSSFSMVCIRKMYVLCSRGTNEHEVRNHVAKCALPRFLKRCHHVICTFSEESQYTPLGDRHVERPKLEELICILEVLATMTLSPDVADSIMPQGDPMTEYVRLMRQRPDVARRGKERTHLLFLYDALCSLITCRESRVRDMLRDLMQLAGADLGFSLHIGI